MRTGNHGRIERLSLSVKKKRKIMDKQCKFPKRSTVFSANNRPRSKAQFSSILRIMERSACLFNDQCAEQAMLLVDIGEQMIMEEYGPQLLICKKAFH